ncbi:hypothetical protein DPMN_171774 [Dreissena polymorpha]|uniref:Uncharacterized protein n=1 Tax=Dreissena polymorpha TaxID=45954 RepID=A0A9D4DYL5_DREPO|nr:hypothetical protein DPMN_171774 [Dreissena polymorpha]
MIRACHKRSAEKLLMGCLNNGGLYVKLGQGLVSMNHILPKEYVDTLVILQDKALHMGPEEVQPFLVQLFFCNFIHISMPGLFHTIVGI